MIIYEVNDNSIHKIHAGIPMSLDIFQSQFKSIIFAPGLTRLNFDNLYLHKSRFCTSKAATHVLRIPIIQQII